MLLLQPTLDFSLAAALLLRFLVAPSRLWTERHTKTSAYANVVKKAALLAHKLDLSMDLFGNMCARALEIASGAPCAIPIYEQLLLAHFAGTMDYCFARGPTHFG